MISTTIVRAVEKPKLGGLLQKVIWWGLKITNKTKGAHSSSEPLNPSVFLQQSWPITEHLQAAGRADPANARVRWVLVPFLASPLEKQAQSSWDLPESQMGSEGASTQGQGSRPTHSPSERLPIP